MCVCVCVCVCVRVRVRVCVCVCVWLYALARLCLCVQGAYMCMFCCAPTATWNNHFPQSQLLQVRSPGGDKRADGEGVQAAHRAEQRHGRLHPGAQRTPPPAAELAQPANRGQRPPEETGAVVPGEQRHRPQRPHEAEGDVYTAAGQRHLFLSFLHSYNMMPHDSISHDALRYDTIRYDTIRYDTIRCDTIRYDTIRHSRRFTICTTESYTI